MADNEKPKGEDRWSIRRIREVIKKDEKVEPIEVEPEKEPVEAEPVKAEAVKEPPKETPTPITEPPEEKKGFFSQFPRLFWVMNSLELFERGAYYGMMAVLGVHVIDNLHILEDTWGVLYAMLIVLLYFIPLISGALALKYGFKRVLLGAFIILIMGYFVVSSTQIGQIGVLTIGLIFIGIGAGSFKPIISASIAHITYEKQRNLAYSIYYWMINLGAFAVPLALGFIFPEERMNLFFMIFIISGVLIIINTFITFSLVTEPVEPQKELSIKQAVLKIVPALKDRKFVILLAIYSGFWFMYAVNHTFMGKYMLDFHRMPSWFSLPFLAIVNPGTIIILGPFLGKLVEKYKSLNVMMVGMFIYLSGLLITFFTGDPLWFITGIIIYSIGEFITHPGFISYVSKISPKDKVTIYMACVFIPTGVGNAVGGVVQGVMYRNIVRSVHMPKLFGAIIAATGMLTISCLIIYNRWINKMAKKEDKSYEEDRSLWTKSMTAGIALMFIPVIIWGGFAGGTDIYYGSGNNGDGGSSKLTDWSQWATGDGGPITSSGLLQENSETVEEVAVSEPNVISITFTLAWTDEPDSTGFNNEGDEFELIVEAPDGDSKKGGPTMNPEEGEGSIKISISYSPDIDPYLNGTGTYNVTIKCNDCGDQRSIGPLGVILQTDDSNTWNLEITYDYYFKEE